MSAAARHRRKGRGARPASDRDLGAGSRAIAVARGRRVLLALAVGLAVQGAAAAVTVNPRGLGQVLLYPYYTVNAGNDTYVSVTNTTNRGKAIKVRFRESRNSRAVMDLNVYLSPYDVWTAALVALDASGPANLLTRDTTCTVPAIRTNASLPQLADGTRFVPFRNFAYSGPSTDNGGASVTRTREGFLEVIEMGELSSGSALTQVLEEVSHSTSSGNPNSGVPVNCSLVLADWDAATGAWSESSGNPQADIGAPTGGLLGSLQVINVANGILHSYAATAIEGFYGGSAPPGGLHTAPASSDPDLASASVGAATIESLVILDNGSPRVSRWNAGSADAVSAILMQETLYNEFDTEYLIGASSEWLITFPTKSYYTRGTDAAIAPFSDVFFDDGRACEAVTYDAHDRDETPMFLPEDCLGTCPPAPYRVVPRGSMCFAAQVVSFAQSIAAIDLLTTTPTAIFGSNAASDLRFQRSGITGDRGTVGIGFPATKPSSSTPIHRLTSIDGDVYHGLPVLGFWAANIVNSNARPGTLANYGGSIPHRGVVRVERPAQ